MRSALFAAFFAAWVAATNAVASPSLIGVEPNIFVKLSKKVVPSVVNISTTASVQGPHGGRFNQNDFWNRFFDEYLRRGGPGYRGGDGEGEGDEEDEGPPMHPGRPGQGPKAMSLGTGFIIDSSGLILTNNHVVAGADEIKITFTEEADEKPTDGEVVGRDPELDLALVKVKSKREMVPLPLGDSDSLEVGEYVIAVGNPFGQGHSVTHGIISAKDRKSPEFRLANYLQTDAPINPGNSGGPLVNLKGEVIGINNAIDQRAVGIGFAIPISLVKKVLPQLKSKGTVSRGYIGVLVNEMSPELADKMGLPKDSRAPIVTQVFPEGPADKAGIKPYDAILEFNGKPIRSSDELVLSVTQVLVNDSVPIKIIRNGTKKDLSIKVAQRPSSSPVAKDDSRKKTPKDKKPARPDTGMELEDVDAEIAKELGMTGKPVGVAVASTAYGGPADKAGILRGDVILEVDRKAVKDVDAFYALVKGKKSYLLRIRRSDPQGREVFTVAVLDLR